MATRFLREIHVKIVPRESEDPWDRLVPYVGFHLADNVPACLLACLPACLLACWPEMMQIGCGPPWLKTMMACHNLGDAAEIEWGVHETGWLRYWLMPTGLKPWSKIIDAILGIQRPQHFRGAVTYSWDMWPQRPHTLTTLTAAAGKASRFE
jgi:hypothetical protein